jgi:hypothetical protein
MSPFTKQIKSLVATFSPWQIKSSRKGAPDGDRFTLWIILINGKCLTASSTPSSGPTMTISHGGQNLNQLFNAFSWIISKGGLNGLKVVTKVIMFYFHLYQYIYLA